MLYARWLMVFVYLGLAYGCEYQLNEIYNNPVNTDVKAPEISSFSINIDLQADTIFLYNSKEIQFSLNTHDRRIQAVELIIDGVQKEIIIESEGQLVGLNYYSLTEGNHNLKLNFYTNSGTGSIADQLNQESFLLSRECILYVDKSYSERKETKVKDGLIQLSWAKNKNADFKEFIIYKRLEWGRKEIGRTANTYFTDISYVGEECNYFIKAFDGENEFQWCYFNLDNEISEVFLPMVEDNKYKLSWLKSRYYNAIDSVIIEERLDYFSDWERIKQTDDLNDSICILDNVYFSQRSSYRLILVPKTDDKEFYWDNIYNFTKYYEGYIGYDIKQRSNTYSDFYPISQDEIIIRGDNDNLITYSFSDMEKLDEVFYHDNNCSVLEYYNITTSSSGKNMTCYVGCDDNILFTGTKPVSFDLIRDLRYLISNNWVPGILISDVSTCVVPDRWAGEKVLYNYKTGEELLRFENSNTQLRLSFNGEYYWGGHNGKDRLLRFTKENKVEVIWESNLSYSYVEFFEFSPVNEHEAVIWDKEEIRIINCRDFSTISSFELTNELLCDVDHFQGQVLSLKKDELLVRDLITGEILYKVSLYPNVTNWSSHYRLHNNKIFHTKGVVYFL